MNSFFELSELNHILVLYTYYKKIYTNHIKLGFLILFFSLKPTQYKKKMSRAHMCVFVYDEGLLMLQRDMN